MERKWTQFNIFSYFPYIESWFAKAAANALRLPSTLQRRSISGTCLKVPQHAAGSQRTRSTNPLLTHPPNCIHTSHMLQICEGRNHPYVASWRKHGTRSKGGRKLWSIRCEKWFTALVAATSPTVVLTRRTMEVCFPKIVRKNARF